MYGKILCLFNHCTDHNGVIKIVESRNPEYSVINICKMQDEDVPSSGERVAFKSSDLTNIFSEYAMVVSGNDVEKR